MDTDLYSVLMKKAGGLLARRAYSRGELRDKLAKIAGPAAVEPVLDRLQQLNLLNDAEYAYNFALCRIQQKGWGPAKVHGSLLRRQVAPEAIEGALARVQSELSDEPALEACVRNYCGSKGMPVDLKDLRRLVSHLHRRGFGEDSIQSVLRRMVSARLWQRFETGE